MAVLKLNMGDASWLDETALQSSIQRSTAVRITMEVPDLYNAESKTDLAQNWLKTWYISESLAKHATDVRCDFHEAQSGIGVVILDVVVQDVSGFVATVMEFAPVFDPDELEAPELIYDEAEDWLDKREVPALLGELEKCYRDDADAAHDEGYRSEPSHRDD